MSRVALSRASEMQSLVAPKSPPSALCFPRTRGLSVSCCKIDSNNRAMARKLIRKLKQPGEAQGSSEFVDCAMLIESLNRSRMPHVAHELLLEMKSECLLPNYAALSAAMLCFADHCLLSEARALWVEIINSSFIPDAQLISKLMDSYAKMRLFDEVFKIIDDLGSRHPNLLAGAYSLAISCFGKHGQLQLMERTLIEMISKGFPVDSASGNAFIRYYSACGPLSEIERVYGFLKRSRHLIEKEGIRAVSSAYIKKRKFHRLRVFLTDVGLGRKNVGNLLWNYMLLSYAVDFKMKSLQREFLRMLESGFSPDLTTFNIRALAFSRMAMFWDLHLTLEHMRRENVVPDIVTCGCVVDAYTDRRLAKNLEFACHKMNLDDSPGMLTDPLVFEALGKGDFHSSSEAFMEFNSQRTWTYRKLVAIYLKKRLRRDQIFWNY